MEEGVVSTHHYPIKKFTTGIDEKYLNSGLHVS